MEIYKPLINKIQVIFINRPLRRILGIRWYDKMRNVDLQKAVDKESAKVLLKRRWTWIRHTLRKPRDNITRRALQWEGHMKHGIGHIDHICHWEKIAIFSQPVYLMPP